MNPTLLDKFTVHYFVLFTLRVHDIVVYKWFV